MIAPLLAVLAGLVAGCGAASQPTPVASPSSDMLTPDQGAGDEGARGTTDVPDVPVAPPPLHPSVDDYPASHVVVDPGDDSPLLPVVVRVADDASRRAHGLMEVAEVPDGVGMWFTYDDEQTGGFWMKGTRTDLDIAWVDDQGRIVAIETMTVCASDPCPSYTPGASYRSALEVRAGWFADNGVEVGDRILPGGR